MPKLTVLRGYSGSGKSTYARQLADGGAVVVSRDAIRPMLTGKPGKTVLDNAGENLVTKIEKNTIVTALRAGRDVVVDNTNLRPKFARAFLDLAVKEGAEWFAEDFIADTETCVFRDYLRKPEERVGRKVIESQVKRFPMPWPALAPTTVAEPTKFTPYVPNESALCAWIFDIDGTLALLPDGYSPYDPNHYQHDTLNAPVAEVLRSLKDDEYYYRAIVLLSGREDTGTARQDTERWLHRNGIDHDALFMRAEGDKRNDAIVKSELFDQFVAPNFNVLGVYDDRQRVVDMWRARGLTCFQVAPGDF